MIIGITGKSGSGKSTYANKLGREYSLFVIHIDDVAHKVLDEEDIKDKLIQRFGKDVIKDNIVDRKYLGDLVFENRHKYKELSDVIWIRMKNIIDNMIKEHSNVILDWILLPHTHYWYMCDKTILMKVDEDVRKQRVLERDMITQEYLDKRDKACIDYSNLSFDEIITLTE